MNMRVLFLLLAVAFFVGGCATDTERSSRQLRENALKPRRQAYERILKNIQPGMTRRQLYALLPPKQTPEVVGRFESLCWPRNPSIPFHRELHPLDRDFSLLVYYRLAEPHDYISDWLYQFRRSSAKGGVARSNKPLVCPAGIEFVPASRNQLTESRSSRPSASAIDALLFPHGGPLKAPRSHENLDDEIAFEPELSKYPKGCTASLLLIGRKTVYIDELFVPKDPAKH